MRTGAPVIAIEPGDGGYTICTPNGSVRARRLVISAGAWVRKLMRASGLEFTATIAGARQHDERHGTHATRVDRIITHANGGLTLKQPDHGTILIGGGWQGLGRCQLGGVETIEENVQSNFRLTQRFQEGRKVASCDHGSA